MKDQFSLPVAGSRFLLVGGGSLVGTATAEALLARDPAEVVIFDNSQFGRSSAMDELAKDDRVKIVSGDILRLPQLISACSGIDGVLHLAAIMTIGIERDPWAGLEVNIGGVLNVIEACRVNRVRKLVFASSNAVYGYGPDLQGTLAEGTPLHHSGARPAAIIYGASKLIGEQLCRDAYTRYGLSSVILRYSTVYGERQHSRAANARLIVESLDSIERGERPSIVGTGMETKHFVYVGDLAEANIAAFIADVGGVALNVSGPDTVTTAELVHLVAEAAGGVIDPELVSAPEGGAMLSVGGPFYIDHSLAAELIGWRPRTGMREGIERVVKWRRASKARGN